MFDLPSYIPFLIRRLAPLIDQAFRNELSAVGLSLEEWRVLIVVHDFGPQSLGSLSALTTINVSTLSRLIGDMARRKLVRRRRTGDDARAVEIGLLRLGNQKCEALLPKAIAFQARITDQFTADEIAGLRSLLKRMYTAFEVEAARAAAALRQTAPRKRRPRSAEVAAGM